MWSFLQTGLPVSEEMSFKVKDNACTLTHDGQLAMT